jgi:flavin reductase (DIM6/NTAB) family NADH-FMN oxidoreductase RutF
MNKAVRNEIDMVEKSFSPTDSRAYRDALGQFATGVTIVTCETEDGPLGMTANSFSSVSLEPALVLWSCAKSASRHDPFVAAERFCINVLTRDQAGVASAFAKDGHAFSPDNADRIDGFWQIRGAAARFSCTRHAVYPGGDHSIILGHVTHVTLGTSAPLVFHSGTFGSFMRS